MPGSNRSFNYCTDQHWKGRADCSHCAIRHLMLFSSLPESSFSQLLKPINNFTLDSGGVLYEENREGQLVYSIRSGLVKLVHYMPDGEQRITRLLGQGSVVGLELLDKGVAYQHTAMAVQPIDVCAIPIVTLRNLEAEHPSLCDRVRQQLQLHVERADHWIKSLNTGVSRVRIAQMLLLLAELVPNSAGEIQLLSREDIAAIVGMTPETISRIVADFRRQGLIDKVAPHRYCIDHKRLMQLSKEEVA